MNKDDEWVEISLIASAISHLARRVDYENCLGVKQQLRQAFSALTEAGVCIEQAKDIFTHECK